MAAAGALRVAVIGGGWAGCAAACELARFGHRVSLLEAARSLGGRARRVETTGEKGEKGAKGRVLDNGQHILLGAYSETLRLMAMVGIDPAAALLRLPLQMPYPSMNPGGRAENFGESRAGIPAGIQFIAPRLPAPLHLLVALLRASGLTRQDKLAIARFQSTARWSGWMLYDDCSVSELLERYDQTATVINLLWRPLCIAALNTPPERASAQVFLNVLKDSLGSRRNASDMLLPKVDLGALFPDRAADYLRRQQGDVRLGARVQALARAQQGWTLDVVGQAPESFDAIVVATPPWQAKDLLEAAAPGLVPGFSYEPITTCYLQYAAGTRLPRPFLALVDNPATRDWGQFVFDRGQLDPQAAGLLAVVISVSNEAALEDKQALASAVAAQLVRAIGDPALASPLWTQVIAEKRATFSCTPALQRPANDTGEHGLWLAGDYTASPYPATIESAVRSGVSAAAGLHQSSSRTRVRA
ncbi:hydroxysqualene dehydroxylase HpnE [Lacisediminimonas profundi]|uniref:hydroxysqualene dehydroxylase HpnE n=1 Tax=Lacisediminimonas profundi TaxID=2603856 RepID=UPI00124B3393|nr:hydroxysqualene dehydroxylase HpnE [Lacisediminimonas profundi]